MPQRDAIVSALNGVMGDHPGTHQQSARHRDATDASQPCGSAGRCCLCTALCMNDQQWMRDGHDHGQALAASLGFNPFYLRYKHGAAHLVERRIARGVARRNLRRMARRDRRLHDHRAQHGRPGRTQRGPASPRCWNEVAGTAAQAGVPRHAAAGARRWKRGRQTGCIAGWA